jgi:oxygen-dependent protoporphyrinogen oxidase
MKRVAIIGGGVSGLAAAYSLEKQRASGVDSVLFESAHSFGGVVRTERHEGCLIEAGPDSFLTEKSWGADLCRDLGLGDHLVGSNDAERKTCILVNRRLVPLPDGLAFMVPTRLRAALFSRLFPWSTKARMIREWFFRPVQHEDETVADFVRRHYGTGMVERVADPLLAGVYGGTADELSVQAVLPRFAEVEARQGSLGRAMVASRKLRSGQERPLFTSLKNGMQELIDGVLARIPESSLRPGTRIQSVQPESGKWLVITEGSRTEEFDAVILAIPAYSAATILGRADDELARELSAIRYTSSVTVALAFDQQVRAALPPGFGFLVPRTENRRILAATFVHNKFPYRAPADRALIRCFLGGSRDEDILNAPEDSICELVLTELREILGITAPPSFARVFKWSKSMAQYAVGHKERVRRIRDLAARMPGLALAGNAYGGIGVPDCIRSGFDASGKILSDLAIAPMSIAANAWQKSS